MEYRCEGIKGGSHWCLQCISYEKIQTLDSFDTSKCNRSIVIAEGPGAARPHSTPRHDYVTAKSLHCVFRKANRVLKKKQTSKKSKRLLWKEHLKSLAHYKSNGFKRISNEEAGKQASRQAGRPPAIRSQAGQGENQSKAGQKQPKAMGDDVGVSINGGTPKWMVYNIL